MKIKGLTGELAIDANGKRNYTKLEVVNLRKDRFKKVSKLKRGKVRPKNIQDTVDTKHIRLPHCHDRREFRNKQILITAKKYSFIIGCWTP